MTLPLIVLPGGRESISEMLPEPEGLKPVTVAELAVQEYVTSGRLLVGRYEKVSPEQRVSLLTEVISGCSLTTTTTEFVIP